MRSFGLQSGAGDLAGFVNFAPIFAPRLIFDRLNLLQGHFQRLDAVGGFMADAAKSINPRIIRQHLGIGAAQAPQPFRDAGLTPWDWGGPFAAFVALGFGAASVATNEIGFTKPTMAAHSIVPFCIPVAHR